MASEFKIKNGLIVVGDVSTSGIITINGALAATQSWVTSQAYLTSASLSGYATQSYVTSAISSLIDAAPAALDTLNELAAALGDDANFSTTITNSIANKVAKSGDTMTGSLLFANVADNVRLQKGSSFLNLRDTWNNIHLYNAGDGNYIDSNIHYWRSQSSSYWMTLNNGNLGIGTVSPVSRLDVDGIISSRGILIAQNSGTYNVIYNASNSVTMYLGGSGDPANYYDNTTHNFRSSGGGTTYAVITNGGNVGIGTTSPGYKLQVYNSSNGTSAAFGGTAYGVRIDNGGTFSSGRSTICGVDNTFYGSYQPLCIGASTLAFSISGTDKVTIDTSGNVGIGTTSPTGRLEVFSSSDNQLRLDASGTYSAMYLTQNQAAKGAVWMNHSSLGMFVGTTVSNGYLALGSDNSNERVRITSAGNVGIGTVAPGARLQVEGQIRISNAGSFTTLTSSQGIAFDSSASTFGIEFLAATSGAGYGHRIIDVDSGAGSGILKIQSRDNSASWSDTMSFRSGSVGINTNTPAYKLDVNGTIRTQTGYILGANGSADITIDGNIGSQLRYGNQKILFNSADAYIYTNNIARLSITNAGIATFSNNLITTNGIADPGYVRITNPEGGVSVGNSPVSAAIKIALPANGSFTNIMLSFTVHIFDYALGKTRTLKIAGYTYYNQDWYNMSVYQSGGELIGNINVRFGVEGGRNCVWIGETNTYWSYPNIFVTDVQCGHSQTANLTSGWTISLVTTLGTVQNTIVAYTNITTKDIGGTTNYVSKFTGATTLGNSLIFDNGTNVGIGTTSPDNILTAKATNCTIDAQSTGDGQTISLRAGYLNNSDLAGYFRYTTGDAQLFIDNNYQGNDGVYSDINIRNKTTDNVLTTRIKIKGSTGNVGIGTTTPGYKLDINGNSRTTGIHYVDTYLVTPYIYGGGPITMGNDVIIDSTSAWNASAAMLNVGGTGDGRIQVRHIYGKSAESAAADHLWLQYQNTGNHVQIGAGSEGNNLYVSGNIYMNGYFGGNLVATQSWVNSQGFLTSVSDIWVNTAGDTMSGTLSFQQPVGLLFANGQYIKDNAAGGLIISSGAAVNINGTSVTINGNTVWHAGNFTNNSSNWNTAYGWGNHASAGYLRLNTWEGNSYIGTSGAHYGTVFYDSNDTSYYVDPSSTSNLNNVSVVGYQYIGGQTSNGQSNYQWDGADYRNPADWTARLILRKDNATTGINGSIPSLVIFNNNGANQTTASMVFATNECVTGSNSVNLAGIIAKKESVGNCGGWSAGSLNFFVKNFGARVDSLALTPDGNATFSGLVYSTGYGNSSQWNTAYSWGNHASYSYATTSYVTTQINNLIAGAPGALDTLDELAAALGDDSNFATTVTNSIAGKVSKAGDTITTANQYGLVINHTPVLGDFVDALLLRSTTSAQRAQLGFATVDADGDHHRVSLRAYKGTQTLEGVFGIALRQPSAAHIQRFTLDYLGNVTIGGFLTESSSLKLKKNVETSEGNLEKVVNLRPVTYNKIGSQTTELGLIAEEVAEVYPEFVQYDENGEPVGVNYSRLTAALIGAVKELTNQVQELNKKING